MHDEHGLDLKAPRPATPLIERHRAAGHWRPQTVLDDVRGWARIRPGSAALVAHHGRDAMRSISFTELADTTERFAGALRGMGVGPGDVVSTWLPSRWELAALMLATWRAGAVLSPMMPAFGPREVALMMQCVGSRLCFTVDSRIQSPGGGSPGADTSGADTSAAALARIAPQVPSLRHQIVLGAPGPGQLAFTEFEDAGRRDTVPEGIAVDADAPAIVMFTSGTTGGAKAVIHSLNTLGSHWLSAWSDYRFGTSAVTYTPQSLSHAVGMSLYMISLRFGGTAVVMERWDPAQALKLMAATETTALMAVPTFVEQMLATTEPAPAGLRHVIVGGTLPTPRLTEQTRERWGLRPRTQWGMTEGPSIYQRPDDRPDEPADGIGRPAGGLETELRADGPGPVTADNPGRLWVRGSTVCLATAARDGGPVRVLADHDDGWYDTGDLACPDGRGGYRMRGRAADRVGGAFMIPVSTVEDALREHPAIEDVALIETHHRGEPVPCAVITATAGVRPPDLGQLRTFLHEQDMTEFYLPRRLEVLDALPRNAMGKIQKALLRDRYRAADDQDPPQPTQVSRTPGWGTSATASTTGDDHMTSEQQSDILSGVGWSALMVAAGRAVETNRADPVIDDPWAEIFVSSSGIAPTMPTHPGQRWPDPQRVGDEPSAVDKFWAQMHTFQGVRSRFMDGQLLDAAQAGVRQVVLLASGLDARAFRLEWPADTTIYEIDRPGVTDFKDYVLTAHDARPRARRHVVPADLRDDWATAVRDAGFDPGVPSVWLAEGLLPFLPAEAEAGLLYRVGELAAPGSTFIVENFAPALPQMRADPGFVRFGAPYGIDMGALPDPNPDRVPAGEQLRSHGWAVSVVRAADCARDHGRTIPASSHASAPEDQYLVARR